MKKNNVCTPEEVNEVCMSEEVNEAERMSAASFVDKVYKELEEEHKKNHNKIDEELRKPGHTKEERDKADKEAAEVENRLEKNKSNSSRNLNKYFKALNEFAGIDTGEKRKPLKMSKHLQKMLKPAVIKGQFYSKRDFDTFVNKMNAMHEFSKQIPVESLEWVTHIKEIIEANIDEEAIKEKTDDYREMIKTYAETSGTLKTYFGQAEEFFKNNNISCLFRVDLFNDAEREAYFVEIIDLVKRYRSNRTEEFTKDDLVIIEFLRLGKVLKLAVERANTDLFIALHSPRF